MERTLDQWFELLASRMDAARPEIDRLRGYTNGNAPLPAMGPALRDSWQTFQRRSRVNMGELIVEAVASRVSPNGIEVGGSDSSSEARSAARIWRDNRLDVDAMDAIRDALTVGVGYLLVTRGADGRAVVTRERPEFLYSEPDPVKSWRSRGALKVWRDYERELDFADMYLPGMVAHYSRPARDESVTRSYLLRARGGKWGLLGIDAFDGGVPIYALETRDRLGELGGHTDAIDRVNWGILQRLVITAMQAHRQRALQTSSAERDALPKQDEEGNPIDYKSIFEPGPAQLWELPPGVELWESQATDLTPILGAVKDDLRFLSAETQTPVALLIPEGANQSAQGADWAHDGLVSKSEDRIKRFRPALEGVMLRSLSVEGVTTDETLRMSFESPALVPLSERYSAASQAKAAGLSLETIQREILGFSPDRIAADKAQRAEDQLSLAALSMGAGGADVQPG